MQFKVQVIVCSDDGPEETVQEIAVLEKDCQRIEQVGLTLTEAKSLLTALQQQIAARQAAAFLATRTHCQACGTPCGTKGQHCLTFRTLFGTLTLPSPRLRTCPCAPHATATFSPLRELLPERTAPELLFLETKWASLMSYELTAQALKDFLPVDTRLNERTVRNHTLAVAQRCEAELGEEQWAFIDGCPRDWEDLPIPDGPLTVGIDGGYVRDWGEKQRHFEVIAGKSILAFKRDEDHETPSSKCFGFVQSYDTKPKRRLFEVLKSQGHQLNQQITFLSDGGDTVRDLQLYLNPQAEHLLDWFHLSMRLTVLGQYAKGLVHHDRELGEEIQQKVERLKWSLWHGNLYKALHKIEDIDALLYNFEETYPKFKQLVKAVGEFRIYIERNGRFIPNYGERWRYGEAIATGFVESTVNQVVSKRFCKKQQMQWSREGAHLLLQTRVKTLNGELRAVFQRWYPDFPVEEEEAWAA